MSGSKAAAGPEGPSGAPAEPIPEAYVLQRVEDALAADGRVGELGLEVTVEGGDVVVRGAVSTPTRKAEVAAVAREVLEALEAGLAVRDETDVPPSGAPEGEEVVG